LQRKIKVGPDPVKDDDRWYNCMPLYHGTGNVLSPLPSRHMRIFQAKQKHFKHCASKSARQISLHFLDLERLIPFHNRGGNCHNPATAGHYNMHWQTLLHDEVLVRSARFSRDMDHLRRGNRSLPPRCPSFAFGQSALRTSHVRQWAAS